jgi:hypothetical protein
MSATSNIRRRGERVTLGSSDFSTAGLVFNFYGSISIVRSNVKNNIIRITSFRSAVRTSHDRHRNSDICAMRSANGTTTRHIYRTFVTATGPSLKITTVVTM